MDVEVFLWIPKPPANLIHWSAVISVGEKKWGSQEFLLSDVLNLILSSYLWCFPNVAVKLRNQFQALNAWLEPNLRPHEKHVGESVKSISTLIRTRTHQVDCFIRRAIPSWSQDSQLATYKPQGFFCVAKQWPVGKINASTAAKKCGSKMPEIYYR